MHATDAPDRTRSGGLASGVSRHGSETTRAVALGEIGRMAFLICDTFVAERAGDRPLRFEVRCQGFEPGKRKAKSYQLVIRISRPSARPLCGFSSKIEGLCGQSDGPCSQASVRAASLGSRPKGSPAPPRKTKWCVIVDVRIIIHTAVLRREKSHTMGNPNPRLNRWTPPNNCRILIDCDCLSETRDGEGL